MDEAKENAMFFSFRRFSKTLLLTLRPETPGGGSLNRFRGCWEDTVPDASDKEPYLCSANIRESHPRLREVLRKSW